MQKNIHRIFVLMLWFAGAFIIGHAVTPHHHHYDLLSDHHNSRSHTEHHSEDNPLHCHAFNELIIKDDIDIAEHIDFIPVFLMSLAEEISFPIEIDNHKTMLIQHKPLVLFPFTETAPLRGSPAA